MAHDRARSDRPRYLVVHFSTELFGSDRMLLESVRGLVESGADVVVMVPGDGPLVHLLLEAGASVTHARTLVVRKDLLSIRRVPRLIAETIRGTVSSWRAISRVRPSAIYISTVTLPLFPYLAKVRRIPSVLHIHEAELEVSRTIRWLLYRPSRQATRIIVNSQFTRGVLECSYPRTAAQASIVRNAVAGPAGSEAARESIDGAVRLLYVGRLSPRKAPDLLLEAAALIRASGQPVHVDIVGSPFAGYEWYEQDLRSRAEAADLAGAVDFHGFQPDVWSFMRDADIVVVPSRDSESFGNVLIEGALASRTVIASRMGALPETANGLPSAHLFDANSVESLSDAIRTVLSEWSTERMHAIGSSVLARRSFDPDVYRGAIADQMLATLGQRAATSWGPLTASPSASHQTA